MSQSLLPKLPAYLHKEPTVSTDLFPEMLPENFASRIVTPHVAFGDIDIRQDEEGRYCLNDLHKAAGYSPNHRPSKWLRHKRTQNLIAEFSKPNKPENGLIVHGSNKREFALIPPVTEAAKNTPTYVIKPLVYAYAAWVSPAFERFVYEVFDAVMSAAVEQQQREAAALYTIRPRWKPIADHPGMRRTALIELTGHKSPGSITACRRRMREVGLIGGRA
ncbi:MAG: KilA-N domain-containing protein [Proteobacteria bacterium]|jgi:hypothetical protein|nr:KilA-N domain-containing protein [Pseudomonadota bacterium]